MIGDIVGIALALAAFAFAGAGILLGTGTWGLARGVLRGGLCVFVGAAGALVVLPWLVYVRIAPTLWLVLALGAISLAAGAALERRRGASRGAEPRVALDFLPGLVLAAPLVVLSVRAAASVDGAYDAFSNWGLKAKLLYYAGGPLLDARIFEHSFATNGSPPVERVYPLGLPALEAVAIQALGGPSFKALDLLFVAFLAGLSCVVWTLLRPIVPAWTLTAGLSLLLWMPAARDQTLSQNADVPLACLWVAAVLFLGHWLATTDPRTLALAVLFSAAALAVKREGAIYAVLLWTVAAAALLVRRDGLRVIPLAAAGAVVIATAVPWRLFVAVNDLHGHDIALSPRRMADNLDRLPTILDHLGELAADPRYLGAIPLAALAAALLGVHGDSRPLALGFLTLLGGLALVLGAVFVNTSNELDTTLETAGRRTLITPALLAAVVLPLLLARLYTARTGTQSRRPSTEAAPGHGPGAAVAGTRSDLAEF